MPLDISCHIFCASLIGKCCAWSGSTEFSPPFAPCIWEVVESQGVSSVLPDAMARCVGFLYKSPVRRCLCFFLRVDEGEENVHSWPTPDSCLTQSEIKFHASRVILFMEETKICQSSTPFPFLRITKTQNFGRNKGKCSSFLRRYMRKQHSVFCAVFGKDPTATGCTTLKDKSRGIFARSSTFSGLCLASF